LYYERYPLKTSKEPKFLEITTMVKAYTICPRRAYNDIIIHTFGVKALA